MIRVSASIRLLCKYTWSLAFASLLRQNDIFSWLLEQVKGLCRHYQGSPYRTVEDLTPKTIAGTITVLSASVISSVAEPDRSPDPNPDPSDPYVFGPPGSGSGSGPIPLT
jgi:hypothetical protein